MISDSSEFEDIDIDELVSDSDPSEHISPKDEELSGEKLLKRYVLIDVSSEKNKSKLLIAQVCDVFDDVLTCRFMIPLSSGNQENVWKWPNENNVDICTGHEENIVQILKDPISLKRDRF